MCLVWLWQFLVIFTYFCMNLKRHFNNNNFKKSCKIFTDRSKAVLLLCIFCVLHAFASLQCCLVVTCWERADLLALVGDVYCISVTFPCDILGQVWYLIVSFPDLCRLSYFVHLSSLMLSHMIYSFLCVWWYNEMENTSLNHANSVREL